MKITTANARKIIKQMEASGVLVSARPYNSGGPGGQHGNRSLNAFELVGEWNLEIGGRVETVRIKARAELKSQNRSAAQALVVLVSKLKAEVDRRRAAAGGRRLPGGFGGAGAARVRTYDVPDSVVVDEAGFKMPWATTAGKGNLAPLIDRRRELMLIEEAA